LAVACCLLSLITLQALFLPPGFGSLFQPFRAIGYNARCLSNPRDYCRRMAETVVATAKEASLPHFREVIGPAPMDVFGNQQIYALLNGFNYRPRPVFQSYAAGNSRLMRINELFYLSQNAPAYVMFSLGAIDRRLAPLEDSLVLRDLLLNYAPAGDEAGFLLLKCESTAPPHLRLLREGTVRLGEPIDLRDLAKTNLWLEIGLDPTLLGRLRQFLYRPPVVRIAAWRDPGRRPIITRRAPAAMLATGFLASPLLLDNDDVIKFYSGDPLLCPGAYSVELLPGQERFWQSAIRFRVSEISNTRRATKLELTSPQLPSNQPRATPDLPSTTAGRSAGL
jgi:hypothetical protein